MPQRKDLRWSQLRVGLVVVVAGTLLAAAVFLVTGQTGLFTATITLHTYSPDAGGLKTGAVVRLAGVDVGSVRRVALSQRPDPNEAVEIVMQVNAAYGNQILTDSQVLLAAEGLLGERYVNITKGTAGTPVPDGGTVPFRHTAEFSELVGGSRDLLDNLNVLTVQLNAIVSSIEAGEGTVGRFIKDDSLFERIDAAVASAESLVSDLDEGRGTLGRFLKDEQFYTQVSSTVTRLNSFLDSLEHGDGTVARLINDPSLYQNAEQLMTRGSTMLENINQGQGTLGKLATDDALFRRIDSAVTELEGLLAGVRAGEGTIGRLFHDDALYSNLNSTSTEVRELIADFRRDPRRFLTVQFRIF